MKVHSVVFFLFSFFGLAFATFEEIGTNETEIPEPTNSTIRRYMRGSNNEDLNDRKLQYIAKGAYVAAKGSYHVPAKGTYVAAKGTYVTAKGTYARAKGTHVPPHTHKYRYYRVNDYDYSGPSGPSGPSGKGKGKSQKKDQKLWYPWKKIYAMIFWISVCYQTSLFISCILF